MPRSTFLATCNGRTITLALDVEGTTVAGQLDERQAAQLALDLLQLSLRLRSYDAQRAHPAPAPQERPRSDLPGPGTPAVPPRTAEGWY